MAKYALTIRTSDFESDTPINQWKCTLVDRAICETDLSTLQVLPYVVVVSDRDCKVFMYSRGKGGAEERIHGLWSIGVGGHIDDVPPTGMSNIEWFAREAAREVFEEIAVEVDYRDFIPQMEASPQLIHLDTTSVDRVHLGVILIAKISEDHLIKLEDGIIENGQFVQINELFTSKYNLENWSQVAKYLLIS